MSDTQKEIKVALEKATPGPWKVYETVYEEDKPYLAEVLIGTAYDHPQLKAPDSIVAHAICAFEPHHRVYIDKADAHLIANAPTWLLHLLEIIEQLQEREFNHYPIVIHDLESRIFAQQDLIAQKDAEIEKLREIQRALVLTPMQKMSRAMDIIEEQKGAST